MRRLLAASAALLVASCGTVTSAPPPQPSPPAPPSLSGRTAPAHVTGNLLVGGGRADIDLVVTADGGEGTVTRGDLHLDALRAGDTFYVRGSATVARFEPPESVACAGDRWVVPPAAAGLAPFAALYTLPGLAAAAGPGAALHVSDAPPALVISAPAGAVDMSGDSSTCTPPTAGPGWSS